MKNKISLGLAAGLLIISSIPCLGAGHAETYHLARSVKVPGDGGWDYVTCDSTNRRLYISHSTQTQIMDIDRLTVIDAIPNTNGVHGIALAPELNRGFISDGRDNQISIFDLKTRRSLGMTKTGENPDAIVYDPMSHRVFAFNGRSHTATIVDGNTGEMLNVLPLDGKPEFAVADGHGNLFVDIEDKDLLLKINTVAMAIEARWGLAPCQEPSSLAIDPATERLFVGCENKTMVMVDATQGKVVAHLPIGNHVDSTVFDAEMKLIFSSNGEGTITAIHEDSPNKFHAVQTIPTQPGARTMALDSTTHRLFLPVGKRGIPGSFMILVVSAG